MILFQDDWNLYPSAIVDDTTSNESFLRIVDGLDKKGIKNCLFPLALYQKELIGVDIFAPEESIPVETKIMIVNEVINNPWYYFRELARVPGGTNGLPFLANRANLSLYWSYFNHITYILIQIRQTGKSISVYELINGLQHFWNYNTWMLLFTKDDALRRKAIVAIKGIRDLMPKWIVPDDKTDANNQIEVTYNKLKNRLNTAVGQPAKESANNVGRGDTIGDLFGDEMPFTANSDISIPAATAALNAKQDELAKLGRMYGTIFTTTAGKIDTKEGKYMYQRVQNSAPWLDLFYDCKNLEELHQIIRDNGRGRDISIIGDFDHRQVGKDDDWLYKKSMEARNEEDPDAIDRDFFSRWTAGGLSSPLTVDQLEKIKHSEMNSLENDIFKGGFIFSWYISKEELKRRMSRSHKFLLGVDTSDAIGRDDVAFVLIDAYELDVIAATTVNNNNLIYIARFASHLLEAYENMILVIEKKSSAQSFIDTVIIKLTELNQDPFKRVYNRLIDNKATKQSDFDEIQNTSVHRRTVDWYDKYRSLFGFNTGAGTRDQLYGAVLKNAIDRTGHCIRDKKLALELRTLMVKNGRIDHSSSGNDDLVIAWLMCHWVLIYGKNLDYYNIDTSRVKMVSDSSGRVGSASDLIQLNKQDELKDKIENILTKLKTTRNPYIETILENQLKVLELQVVKSGEDSMSISSMINDARKLRVKNMKERRRK